LFQYPFMMFGPRARISPSGGDLHFHARDDRTDGADAALVGTIDGDDRRGLGEAVAFEDLHARADEERRQLARQRRAAGDDVLHRPPRRAMILLNTSLSATPT
jgi:hypothetical protein